MTKKDLHTLMFVLGGVFAGATLFDDGKILWAFSAVF